ncbi:MAG: NAD(+) diphosphatase [Cereibacter sphaeroides]|uniref:NAD(+) diphosphatase n=1 Tax=Cereibacter sphaeroides TaxID=1063 RepID=A0A2W5SMH0_CERSP|nr:MAG: NAD(+) diphosphatase [Cereibacter sphaeroides]
MRIAETVTFGGSGLNRAGELRGNSQAIASHLTSSMVLPLWRGKVLAWDNQTLGWLPSGHPVLSIGGTQVFLGLDEGIARFTQDISAWEPDVGTEALHAGFFDPSVQHHPELPAEQGFVELRGIMAALGRREAELAATAKAVTQWHSTHRFCASCGAPSEVVMAGWQRTCPTCGGHHFPRTDPVVIMLIRRGNSALFGRSPGWPEGMYSLLAGFIEPGETLEAAVRREVFEETSVRVGAVRYLASQPWPFPASLMFGCEGEALSEEIDIDPTEIEHALWLTREEMMQVMAGEHPQIRAPRKGAIAHFLISAWLSDQLD